MRGIRCVYVPLVSREHSLLIGTKRLEPFEIAVSVAMGPRC